MNKKTLWFSSGRYNTFIFSMLLIAVISVFFSFFILLDKYPDVEASPLYTNIIDNPVYATSGFDPDVLLINDIDTLTDTSVFQWETVLPREYRGNYLISNILTESDNGNSAFISFVDETDNEYTILIPFEFSRAAMEALGGEKIIIPGVYLSGIGDNWEIYINGSLVKAEMHLDENGQILSHRSMRGIIFPLDKDILQEGTNFIVFRIISSYNCDDNGLFYSSDYYIGNYSDIGARGSNYLTVVFASIYIFMGLYYLIFFLMRKTDTYNLSYSIFAILIAIYFMARTPIIYILIKNTAITQKIEYAAFYMLVFLLAVFIEQLHFGKIRLITKAYALVCLLLITLQTIMPISNIGRFLTIGQIMTFVMVLYVLIFDSILPFVQSIKSQKAKEGGGFTAGMIFDIIAITPVGNFFAAIMFVSFTAIFDIIDSAFLHTGIILTRYSFFIFTIFAAIILARKFSSAFDRIHIENKTLEAAVRARTIELEEQVQIAELASSAKSDFLSNMSHEIRTPIGAVIGMANIGLKKNGDENKDDAFNKILNASTHLLGIINDILDMSKIEANKLELSETEFEIRETIKNVTDFIRIRAKKDRPAFTVKLDDNIPTILYGDNQRLAQIITNLLSNAIKFTPVDGSVTLSVLLVNETDKACILLFDVTDTGIGIPKEDQSKLFTSFQQADNSTSRHYGGTGLGLALSKRIVEMMGGDISVSSVAGEGSTFSFSVELQKVNASPNAAYSLENQPDEEMIDGEFAGVKVLLAEDVEINREIVKTLMAPSGISFQTAVNGKSALEAFKSASDSFDLIFMDIQMPVMDGYTATRNIRNLNLPNAKTIPIIAMTANVFQDDIDKCLEVGMNAHIGKPLNIHEVVAVIRKYLK